MSIFIAFLVPALYPLIGAELTVLVLDVGLGLNGVAHFLIGPSEAPS